MKHIVVRLGLSALFVLSALASIPASTLAQADMSLVAPSTFSGGESQNWPRTDGLFVVWAWSGGPPHTRAADIRAARLSEREVFTLAGGSARQTEPDISGQIVVWAEDGDILARNLVLDQPFTVAATPADESGPAISGNWVVWTSKEQTDTGEAWSVMGWDITTDAPPTVLAQLDTGWYAQRPAVDDGQVTWAEINPSAGAWRIRTMRSSDAAPATVAEGSGLTLSSYDMGGNWIVYVADQTVIAFNVPTGQTRTIGSSAQQVTTNGRYVFWSDLRHYAETSGQRVDLAGYDLATGSAFSAVAGGHNVEASVNAGTLTWVRRLDPFGPGFEIHALPLSQVVPTAPQPDPGKTDPNWLYFPRTGHYVAYGFKSFWQQSGGLPVFGYPLTEEFAERDLTVQYFERQRFEYHPEHAGTPYEILLGRLGSDDALARGLHSTAPFAPLPSNTSSDANCTFVPETGHRLCSGFKTYWQSHGLEFGDSGFSYRESLALFGYPISEEFVDNGMTVQYFERARFEYHPNNPEPYKVLLTRLGADVLTQRGW